MPQITLIIFDPWKIYLGGVEEINRKTQRRQCTAAAAAHTTTTINNNNLVVSTLQFLIDM